MGCIPHILVKGMHIQMPPPNYWAQYLHYMAYSLSFPYSAPPGPLAGFRGRAHWKGTGKGTETGGGGGRWKGWKGRGGGGEVG